MSEHRHGLEPFLSSCNVPDEQEANLRVQLKPLLTHTNLRGNTENVNFLSTVDAALGQALPLEPNTLNFGKRHIYWLGPNEWLILSRDERPVDTFSLLKNATIGLHAAVTDVSGGQLALWLSGPGSREVLAKGCTLDFHPAVFTKGHCAQTGLAKTSMLIGLIDDQPIFEMIIRRSFAEYLASWLKHSAAKKGLSFTATA